ncbi:unnamed protein product [Oikopleura dioica]|uniref:Uncharacterized protein n=1 Tax=Oikopleura dioica TaxID=34765 RepID=E4WUS3_OIKDI|nr:unnamed protein product [Oikopleura dioica]
MGLISRKYPNVYDVTAVSTWADVEFVYNRSACYLRRMATSVSEDIAQVLVGKMKPSVLADKEIINFFLYTGAASYLKYDKRKQTFGYCFQYIKSYVLHKNYYYDVREVRFTREEIIAIAAGGKVYFKAKVSFADWKLLKLHLQTTMAFMIPATQHNWVHFCLPSAVAISCDKLLPETSILRQLLEPHYKFTERLNHQALFVCNASDNKNSFADKYFKPWLAFPMTKEVFIENMSKECQRYYNKRPEEFCPSPFLHDENLVDIPYVKMLRKYNSVVRRFVCQVALLVDPEEWQIVSESIGATLPGIEVLPMADLLTTFIWQVSIVHSLDHEIYVHTLNRNNPWCLTITVPYEPYSNTKFWDAFCEEKGLKLIDVMNDPAGELLNTVCFVL